MRFKKQFQTSARLWYRASRLVKQRVRLVRTRLSQTLPKVLDFARACALGTLWLWCFVHIQGWEWLAPRLESLFGIRARGRHRLLFCGVIALVAGHAVLFAVHLPASLWSVAGCVTAASGLNAGWRRGMYWCEERLGLRPTIMFDPHNPFSNLDMHKFGG